MIVHCLKFLVMSPLRSTCWNQFCSTISFPGWSRKRRQNKCIVEFLSKKTRRSEQCFSSRLVKSTFSRQKNDKQKDSCGDITDDFRLMYKNNWAVEKNSRCWKTINTNCNWICMYHNTVLFWINFTCSISYWLDQLSQQLSQRNKITRYKIPFPKVKGASFKYNHDALV